jgi:hypothetical protein
MLCLVLKAVQAVQHSAIIVVVSADAAAAIEQVGGHAPWGLLAAGI